MQRFYSEERFQANQSSQKMFTVAYAERFLTLGEYLASDIFSV